VILGSDVLYDSISSLCVFLKLLKQKLSTNGIFYGVAPQMRGPVPLLAAFLNGEQAPEELKEAACGLELSLVKPDASIMEAAQTPDTKVPISYRRICAIKKDLSVELDETRPEVHKSLLLSVDRPYYLITARLSKKGVEKAAETVLVNADEFNHKMPGSKHEWAAMAKDQLGLEADEVQQVVDIFFEALRRALLSLTLTLFSTLTRIEGAPASDSHPLSR